MGKTLWRSPNKKWEIVDETDHIKYETDWNDPYSAVAEVSASDGWHIAYARIVVNGRIEIGGYGTDWEYFVPKTIQAKASSLMRAMYKAKKQSAGGKAQVPLQYAVIVSSRGFIDVALVPKPTFYRTYETAVKHAEMEWKKLTPRQKHDGAFVNVGRLEKAYMNARDVPDRFSYSLLGSITKDYNSFQKKRRS